MSSTQKQTENSDKSQQRRQANRMLLNLHLLLTLLLVLLVLWLYAGQQRFATQLQDRLQSNDKVMARLNDMDDRLFAISRQTLPKPSQPLSNNAQNQLMMFRLQLQAADKLLLDGDCKAAIAMLQGMQWQLGQDSNDIAPALSIVLNNSLQTDIDTLQAQKNQPSAWQLHILAMTNIQSFLRMQVKERTADDNPMLSKSDVWLHEAMMTLNLAIQAANMRQADTMQMYLEQTRQQLQYVDKYATNGSSSASTEIDGRSSGKQSSRSRQSNGKISGSPLPTDVTDSQQPENNVAATAEQSSRPTLTNISDAVLWLDDLMMNTPKAVRLVTAQMLDDGDANHNTAP